ncbi:hypothetical protein PF004_g28365 [Phytophthora fragariae]|uniref:Uncharacterized protein n=1 Tax=Phytophthora fragariae TaxID=53985 RepID=A0A6G0MHX1_9STRA|nr:hypothetical protein PF004_g28365 [Phytophthora fragariae]
MTSGDHFQPEEVCSKTRDNVWCLSDGSCNIRGVLRYHFEDRLLERAENSEEIVQGVPELVDLAAFLIHLFAEGFVQCSDTQ